MLSRRGSLLAALVAVLAGSALLPGRSQAVGRAARRQPGPPASAPALVTDEVLRRADDYPADWLHYAKNYRGHRFSPLEQIDRASVGRLVPKWCFSLGTLGPQQCTPIVHRGVMYVTAPGGKVMAVKADSGELLWKFDAKLPEDAEKYGPLNNRGAAVYQDRVIWIDVVGRIWAHEAATGKVVWQAPTDYFRLGYTKTLAPLVVKGKVVFGTSGGEYGIRGYVEARDAATGKRAWKTYTVPAPGEPGSETWPTGSDAWEHGGAPTWMTGSYDPDLDLIYWTTGNGGPWSAEERAGDNLYCCSVLALDADSGRLRWHYQFVPNDDWDYDCNGTPVLAEIEHEGKPTPVLALAVKNGYFYVLDRRNGRFLKHAQVAETLTWAKGLESKTGRPIEAPGARPPKGSDERVFVAPSALGTVNWWGMAFHPRRNWMVLVANETGMMHCWDPIPFVPGEPFIGDKGDEFLKGMRRATERPGRVCAWDLKSMKKQWEAEPELEVRWGGAVVTGGELVLAGTMRGFLQALDAETGRRLWQFQTGSGIMAHPVTYAVDGKQYVAVVSGRGGVANPAGGAWEFFKHLKHDHSSGMVFAFGLP